MGDLLTVETGNLLGPMAQGIDTLVASDPDAYWDPAAHEGRGGVNSPYGDQSPRVIAVPVYDPYLYEMARRSGRVQISVVRFVGFFVLGMDGTRVVGHLTGWSTLSASDATAVGGPATLTASLVGPGSPLSGVPVEFSVDGTVVATATTDATGTATLADMDVSNKAPGVYPIDVRLPPEADFFIAAPARAQLRVGKSTPRVTWPDPEPIVYGTPLGASQLNATSDVEGRFDYTPPAGTVLHAGPHTLSARFIPTDPTTYNEVETSAWINVTAAALIVKANNQTKAYLAPLPAFTASYKGFVNGDTPAALAGTLTFSTQATQMSPVGPYPITAGGVSSTDYAITFVPGTLTITAASTTTSLVSSLPSSVFGQPVTLTATVAGGGGSTPTGTVTFKENGQSLGSGTLSGGTAAVVTSTLAVGSLSLMADYSGDGSFSGSTSPVISHTVAKADTSTAVTSSSNPSVRGQAVTFSVRVMTSAPGSGIPSGAVTFKDGAVVLGTATLSGGQATHVASNLAVGSHPVTAEYAGSGDYNGSTSAVTQVVSRAETVTTATSAPNPSTYGQAVTFTASVTIKPPGNGTLAGSVTFKEGSVLLGTVPLSSGQAVLTTPGLSGGNHVVTAEYTGTTDLAPSTSATMIQTVARAASTTSLTVAPTPSTFGQLVTLTALVVSSGGILSGSVQFLDGGTLIGTTALNAGSAVLATTALTGGAHLLTAVYVGDTNFTSSGSPVVAHTVDRVSSVSTLVSAPNPSSAQQPVTFTVTVTLTGSAPQPPSGQVQVLDSKKVLATVPLAGGVATLTTTKLATGKHSISAKYQGDGNFTGSTSNTVMQWVKGVGPK